jgi:hypothetical protein
MESLALLIMALVAIVLFTGPVSLLLTSQLFWNFTLKNSAVWMIRRVFLAVISFVGMSVQIIFVLNQLPLATKLFAILGLGLNIIALKKEFLRKRAWSSIFKMNPGDQNGPPGQS